METQVENDHHILKWSWTDEWIKKTEGKCCTARKQHLNSELDSTYRAAQNSGKKMEQ